MQQARSWCIKDTSANNSERLQVVTFKRSCDIEKDSLASRVANTNHDEVVRSLKRSLASRVADTNHDEPYLADVNISFITVGNEVIPGPIGPQVLPVMQSLTNLVKSRNLPIAVSTVVAMSNLKQSYPPSAGKFTSQAREQLVPVLKLLSQTSTPILVNIYPYASDPTNIPLDYATFNTEAVVVVVQDGPLGYSNMFDAIFDAFNNL
ncbi:Glycoside hydrolase family 17 [Arabidopsis suecica]|uniref:glucan endo-1,3-beta-D-glucosidase n=1 Tax=Arabidopsis suecica TaxID=45249 RepID=A0A8T2CWA8_ARASU|nr:Glycoside hydrolase family 17 [Arabidopsis suecica]